MINQNQEKHAAAQAAVDYIQLHYLGNDWTLGVGTGSTINVFIDRLATLHNDTLCVVSSSESSTQRLKQHGIAVQTLNDVAEVTVYVDGADEVNPQREMIKGGGGALTREKIIAAAAKTFICIADHSKWVTSLGSFPLPIEVIPMARSYVARELVKLGGKPVYRTGFVTDNGNVILDIHDFAIKTPRLIEETLNHIAGIVSHGIFALRPADIVFLAHNNTVQTIR